jgi:hypothetical protein
MLVEIHVDVIILSEIFLVEIYVNPCDCYDIEENYALRS